MIVIIVERSKFDNDKISSRLLIRKCLLKYLILFFMFDSQLRSFSSIFQKQMLRVDQSFNIPFSP